MNPPHPDAQKLAAYKSGKLPELDATTIEAHLSSCETCLEAFVKLPSADSLEKRLRGRRASVPTVDKPVQDWIDELRERNPLAKSSQTEADEFTKRLSPPQSPDELGRLGRYRILNRIGRGGMGAVYLAHDTQLDRQVALKIPHFSADDGPRYLERFLREARAAATLDHPNICPVHDVGEINGVHFISMAYIVGKTLAEMIPDPVADPSPPTHLPPSGARGQSVSGEARGEKKTPRSPSAGRGAGGEELAAAASRPKFLPERQVAAVIRELALALAEAHARGIVHRDLKPSNIMVNKRRKLVIMDFGLAGQVKLPQPGTERLTHSGMMIGTPAYMSLEQVTGDLKQMGPGCDIYSLGVIMYEMLTGRLPFEGPVAAILGQIMVVEPSPPSSLLPGLDPQLEAICMKAMSKKISDRHASMTELANALTGYLQRAKKQAKATSTSSKQRGPGGNFVGDPSLQQFFDQLEKEREAGPVAARKLIEAGSPSQTQGVPHRPRSRYLLPVAVAASVLLAVGAYFAPQVIRIVTNKGVIVIEAADKDVEVAIRGESLTIHDQTTKQAYHLKIGRQNIPAGEYWLEVTTDAGLEVDTPEFKITRNGKRVVKVSLEKRLAGREAGAGTNTAGSSAPRAPGVNSEPSTGWRGWPADAPPPAIAPFDADTAERHQEAWAKHLKIDMEFTNSIGMKFRLIPPGEFTMGSTPAEIEEALKVAEGDGYWPKHWQECIKSEAPQHKVILTQPIYLGVHEVTQAEYEKVMGKNPSYFATTGPDKVLAEKVAGMDTTSHPVDGVSWNDAAEFCAKLSQQEKLKPFYFRAGETVTSLDGTGYRLPSEAEWELACRAGTTTKYWIGDKGEELMRAGWFGTNSGGRTHAVGELKANPFGLYDIHGNVREWVQDGWAPTYYGQFREMAAINPNFPFSAGSPRGFRGGGWRDLASGCRASHRDAFEAASRDIGFRVSLVCGVSRVAVKDTATPTTSDAGPLVGDNVLTDRERADGWILLFDGKSTKGWMTPKGQPLPDKHVQERSLNPHPCEYMLVQEKVWENFRLSLDFKITPKCNSGVFIRTFPLTPRSGKDVGFNGMEVAIDDTAGAGYHDTGAIYELVKPKKHAMKPVGEWNHIVITCDRNIIQVELNGEAVTRMDLDEWVESNKRPDGSAHKFDVAYKTHPRKGYIGLQDHGSDCWFKNIKLLPLSEDGFVSLFDGRTLSGWKPHSSQKGNWRVVNGVLIGSGPSGTSHLYTERDDYKDFHLRLEARINEGGNSGVYFRTAFGPARPANDPRWLNGYNAKIDGNRLGGFLLDHPVLGVPLVRSHEPSVPAGQWLTLEVIVQGNHIVVKTNGETTAEYTDEKRCFTTGHIALQQHTPATVAEFRKIEIKELPPTKPLIDIRNVVLIETSLGTIEVELNEQKAPITVKNFLGYVDDRFYDGTVFHRVIQNFVVQGGGMEPGLKEKRTNDPITNEASNDLSNLRGTIAMVRTNDPDSATSQFFINVVDNPKFDKSGQGAGYCVFGKVIEGMDVVDKIVAVETETRGEHQNVPVTDVVIKSIRMK